MKPRANHFRSMITVITAHIRGGARARARASEKEETLATHPDLRQRSRRVIDVTDPTQSETETMKPRANRFRSVITVITVISAIVLVFLLGFVLLTVFTDSEMEPEPTRVEPEPTRGLQDYRDYHHHHHHHHHDYHD